MNYLIVAGVLVGFIAIISLIERKPPSFKGIAIAVGATSLCAIFAFGGAVWLLQNPAYLTIPAIILAVLWALGGPVVSVVSRRLNREAWKNEADEKPNDR